LTDYRVERDSLGDVHVPAEALYGAQTQRAVENFDISGMRFPRVLIRALGLIKAAAAQVNVDLGLLDTEKAAAIEQAAEEVADGRWDDHFPIDIFQTGSGTSTNMNANEVIANRATQILGGDLGSKLVHPNDDVNMGQSSNDVIPTAIHVSAMIQVDEALLPGLRHLQAMLRTRAADLDDVVKTGRTHLMDAMPVRMGQEVGGWAYQVEQGIARIESCQPRVAQLALGGTAVGTGVNAHPEFGRRVAEKLAARTNLPFAEAGNHFAAQAALDTVTELSGHLKTMASALLKIANDMRWMNSGPMAGLGEIVLPALQPGSSIMPGKINPVICEAMMMVCAQVIGNDVTVTMGNAAQTLADKAIAGMTVNREHIARFVEQNPILVTALNPVIGYDKAAQIAKKAYAEGRRIKEVAAAETDLSPEELDRLLDPLRMT
jgi:fumarate hydratase class II